jgi:methionyl-tRNA formyltransferase
MSADTPKIVFAGTPEFAAIALQALIDDGQNIIAVYTQPDRPAGRGRKLTASPVKQLAEANGIRVEQPASLKDASAVAQLGSYEADVMIVAAYGLLLPQAVLDIPRHGCINIHASLLPRWRGAAPIQRAILAGDKETGITIMQMDAGLDTGDMLLKIRTPINDDDTAASLHDRLAKTGGEAIVKTMDLLDKNQLVAEKQDEQAATYASKLLKQEAWIDWSNSASQIDRQVRAFIPWPIAQSILDNKVVRIHEAFVSQQQTDQPAGTIVQQSKDDISVACGEGVITLTRCQLPNSKPMKIADILNGHPDLFSVGTAFKNSAQ